jgi:hypothetical protein
LGEQGGQVNRPGHVVKQEAEMRMDEKVLDILLPPGDEIVEADHIVALRQKAVAEMRAQKARPAGHQGQRPEILAGQGI